MYAFTLRDVHTFDLQQKGEGSGTDSPAQRYQARFLQPLHRPRWGQERRQKKAGRAPPQRRSLLWPHCRQGGRSRFGLATPAVRRPGAFVQRLFAPCS